MQNLDIIVYIKPETSDGRSGDIARYMEGSD